MWLSVLINEKYCHFEAGTLIKPILVVEPIPAVKPIPALEPNPVVNITPSIPIPIPTNFFEVNVIPIPKKIGIITPLFHALMPMILRNTVNIIISTTRARGLWVRLKWP